MKVRNLGGLYIGQDPWAQPARGFHVETGGIIEVTERKWAQLQASYPGRFEVVPDQRPAETVGGSEREAGEPRLAPAIRRRGRARA